MSVLRLFSKILNRVFFGGSFQQTLSARAYTAALGNPEYDEWDTYRARINLLFFWQRDMTGARNHCYRAWRGEVDRARDALALNGVGH